MNNSDIVYETADSVLGQEFLTWLWYRSETAPGSFVDKDSSPFSVTVGQRVVVQGGEGDLRETTTVSGGMTDGSHLPLREARLGLLTGKKVTRALLSFEQDSMQWQMTVKADDFLLSSVRTPKPAANIDEDDHPDAIFLEKMYLLDHAVALFDLLYDSFLEIRLNRNEWAETVRAMATWMARQE